MDDENPCLEVLMGCQESTGSARERAIGAMERIGPCTFNAVLSTLLAVIVVGFSESYVFRIFFKVAKKDVFQAL